MIEGEKEKPARRNCQREGARRRASASLTMTPSARPSINECTPSARTNTMQPTIDMCAARASMAASLFAPQVTEVVRTEGAGTDRAGEDEEEVDLCAARSIDKVGTASAGE